MSQSDNFRRATRRLLFPEPIPSEQEIPGAGHSAATMPERHTRVKITINLDGEVIHHFKLLAQQEGRPYQSLINQVLREYVAGTRSEQVAEEVKLLLLQDKSFLAQLRQSLNTETPSDAEPK